MLSLSAAPPPASAKSPRSGKRRYTLQLGDHEVVAGHLYELLVPAEGTETIGVWSNRFANGRASITSRTVGAGRVVYAGTYLTEPLVPLLFEPLLARAGVEPLLASLPAGVEASLREGAGRRLLFILNTLADPVEIADVPAGSKSGRRRAGSWRGGSRSGPMAAPCWSSVRPDRRQHTVLNRSTQVATVSSPGRFHQFSAEKISTSCGP